MKKLVIGGIENKVVNLLLATIILITAAFLVMMLYQNNMLSQLTARTSERQQDSIATITTVIVDQVVDENMNRAADLETLIADEMFQALKGRVEMLGECAQKLIADPEGQLPADYKAPDPERDGEITAQLILADGVDGAAPELAERLGLVANMTDMMISMFGMAEETNSCFVALPEGAFLVVDDRSAAKFADDGAAISYDPRTRPWYIQAVEQGGLIFTDVEVDAFTGAIGIVCAMPVYCDGQLQAVVGSDLFLSSMQAAVQSSDKNGSYVVIVNRNGHVVFSPKTEGVFQVLDSSDAVDLRESENTALAALVSDAMRGKTDVRIIDLEDESCYMIGAPMKTVGWALIAAFSQDRAAQPAIRLQEGYKRIQNSATTTYRGNISKSRTTITILMALLFVLLIVNALILGRRIVRPLNTITLRISELNERHPEFHMEDAYRTGDEIEVLAQAFATLSHKTVGYVDQVKRVTAERERINSELNMAREIQSSQLPRFFQPCPDNSYFDLYASMTPAREVGGDFYDFFMVDDDHLALVIADVSGKGVPAALFMMIAKILIKNRLQSGESVSDALANVNNQLLEGNEAGMFVTAWVSVLTISTGEGVVVNAGHEHPAFCRAGGTFELLKYRHSMVMASLNDLRFREHRFTLNPGDCLFVYTDGVPEATNSKNELMGEARMLEALNRNPDAMPDQIIDNVKAGIDKFVAGAEQFDDITMLCLKYHGAPGRENEKA